MACLPEHGRILCTKCFDTKPEFDKTKRVEGFWRITSNPLAWGNPNAETVVLGFSKGPTQAGALATTPHNDIAYKGGRANVAKILAHIGMLSIPVGHDPSTCISEKIANSTGSFHFGSLIRCTVERFDEGSSEWKGSGGGMLDKFVATAFGQSVARNCIQQHLANFSDNTKLIVMFGLGSKLNYVKASFNLFMDVLGGAWSWINDVAYTNGKIIVVHVEHFASQGALISQWMGTGGHERGKYGQLAKDAVASAFTIRETQHTKTLTIDKTILTAKVTTNRSITPPQLEERDFKVQGISIGVRSDIGIILKTIEESGYRLVNENKKLAEFCSESGKSMYVLKTGATLNNIKVMVHPGLNSEALRRLSGVDSVSPEHRFHSNMPQFPKRLHTGKTEITFGWQLTIGTLGALESFLNSFDEM